jgi:arylsulfatase A-like enzyme
MNGYRADKHGALQGWNEWYGSGNGFRNYSYTLSVNGKLVTYGDHPKDYLTDVLARKASGVIRRAAEAEEPFFLYIAPFTPHTPATWAPRHALLFDHARLPRPPSFNEVDVSDKPTYVYERLLFSPSQIEHLEHLYQKRLKSLQATDDMVETLIETLQQTGQLHNTFIVYTSDNGFKIGEHRLRPGKDTAYEEDIHVPLVMRGPGVPAGRRLKPIVLNIDLAPTFAQIAGVKPPDYVDGRSFMPLFENPSRPWRQSFMVGRLQLQGLEQAERAGRIRFKGIRTSRWTYVEYAGTNGRELYDLNKDPYQLENAIQEVNPHLVQALSSRLDELANCKATECRRFENLPIAGQALSRASSSRKVSYKSSIAEVPPTGPASHASQFAKHPESQRQSLARLKPLLAPETSGQVESCPESLVLSAWSVQMDNFSEHENGPSLLDQLPDLGFAACEKLVSSGVESNSEFEIQREGAEDSQTRRRRQQNLRGIVGSHRLASDSYAFRSGA